VGSGASTKESEGENGGADDAHSVCVISGACVCCAVGLEWTFETLFSAAGEHNRTKVTTAATLPTLIKTRTKTIKVRESNYS
jgi:hypothetical protein